MKTRGGASPASDGQAADPALRPRAVESWTSTAADVDAWLDRAKQGDVLIYAHGPTLIQGAAAARIRKMIDDGDVVALPQRRCADGGFDYRVARNRARLVSQRAPVCDPTMMRVLLEVQADAAAHRRCRSDAELGQATGLTADQVKWQLKKLEAGKFIARRTVGCRADPKFRVVKVVATGAETAMPEVGR